MNDDELKKLMGANLRQLRESRHISRRDFSILLGISEPFLVLIEGGKRGLTAKYIKKIAELFEVSADEIFAEDSDVDIRKNDITNDIEKIKMYIYKMNHKKIKLILNLIIDLYKI